MHNRSANDALQGYYYQFDKTLLSFLSSPINSNITIEGLEDIDINSLSQNTIIQCKYLSSKKYSLPVLRPAIILLFENFILSSTPITCILYVHFNDITEKIFKISIEEAKELFKYKKSGLSMDYLADKKISDETLKSFLENFTIEIGKDFETQRREVFTALGKVFSETTIEGKNFYYARALAMVYNAAIQKDINDRKIRASTFINSLKNAKHLLFDQWFHDIKSRKQFIKFLRDVIKNRSGLQTQSKKFLILNRELIYSMGSRLPLERLMKNLNLKYFALNKTLADSECWTVVLDLNKDEMLKFKKQLIKLGIKFNDGREDIEFSSELFNDPPVIRISRSRKMVQCSYEIRVLALNTYKKHFKGIFKPDSVFDFSGLQGISFHKDSQKFQIKARDLDEVSQIIS